jgi:hypothetical protein
MSLRQNTFLLIGLLIGISCAGVGLGFWLFHAGFVLLGCIEIGVWLWNAQRFALWLLAPPKTATIEQPLGRAQRLLLALLCLVAAGVSAWGVYWWYLSPEDWQAGLVFILFGLIVLIPVTMKEVRLRRKPYAPVL